MTGGDINMNGGTPYTSEIYGYYVRKYTVVGLGAYSSYVYDKYYFTRNDMVTSGGSFGTAKGVTNPFDNTTN